MLYSSLPSLFLLFGVSCLAFWRNDAILYFVSGLFWISYGFTVWTTSEYFSIGLVVVGIAVGIKAFIKGSKE